MTDIIMHTITPDQLKQILIEAILEAQSVISNPQQPQPDQDEELIKIEEASKLLNVSKATIHAWKKAGLIPFHRISNKIYFKKNEIINSLKKVNRGVK